MTKIMRLVCLVTVAVLGNVSVRASGADVLSIVIKDAGNLSSGPWLSSMESGDDDITWRPELQIAYTAGGQSAVKEYKRAIGGSNPLSYWIASNQSAGNFYDAPDGDLYRGHKYGDAMLIKNYLGRVGFFQCDISGLPSGAVISSVTYKGHVEPSEGRSGDGALAIYRCTAPWTRDSITKSISGYQGALITTLPVRAGTFVKGSAWWSWNWDSNLVAYVQEIADNSVSGMGAGTAAPVEDEIRVGHSPDRSMVTVSGDGVKKAVRINVYNQAGTVKKTVAVNGADRISISTGGWPAGILIAEVVTAHQTIIRKAVLIK